MIYLLDRHEIWESFTHYFHYLARKTRSSLKACSTFVQAAILHDYCLHRVFSPTSSDGRLACHCKRMFIVFYTVNNNNNWSKVCKKKKKGVHVLLSKSVISTWIHTSINCWFGTRKCVCHEHSRDSIVCTYELKNSSQFLYKWQVPESLVITEIGITLIKFNGHHMWSEYRPMLTINSTQEELDREHHQAMQKPEKGRPEAASSCK